MKKEKSRVLKAKDVIKIINESVPKVVAKPLTKKFKKLFIEDEEAALHLLDKYTLAACLLFPDGTESSLWMVNEIHAGCFDPEFQDWEAIQEEIGTNFECPNKLKAEVVEFLEKKKNKVGLKKWISINLLNW